MKRTLLYLCMASVLLSGCWSEDDGEGNYQDKPQRAASLTMERAMGLLCELMLSVQEKGDTLLMNQQIMLMDYDPIVGNSFGYEISVDELHISWETMPSGDANRWGGIGNTRIQGTGTVRTIEEHPLVLEFETISDLLFKSSRVWESSVYDRYETRFLSGAAKVKVSGGLPGDPPLEFLMRK